METLKIYEGYFENDSLRTSFNQLAINTFGLDFEPWYQNQAYYEKYFPFSLVKDNKVVANISVNYFDLIVDGVVQTALQLGTVMTDENYRNQGLSKQLMDYILNKYENEYDFIFLFANQTVLNFYPKFGFKRIQEYTYLIDATTVQRVESPIRILDTKKQDEKLLILNACKNRKPVSTQLGVLNADWPLLAYALGDDWVHYYVDDILVLAKHEDSCLHVYDIITPNAFTLDSVLEKLVTKTDQTIQLHFVPDNSKYEIIRNPLTNDDDTLFIRSKKEFHNDFLFPATSHT